MVINDQSTLRVGDTLVPLIFISDGTHLSNFGRDETEWPVYMTIGNLSSMSHQMPSTHSITMVVLLPIPIKNHNIPPKRLDEQQRANREVLNEVLWWVLQPLTIKHNPSTESGYYNVLCADGNNRHWKPVLAAWLADCPPYSHLHHVEQHVCFWCECPRNQLGDHVPPDQQHPRQDHNLYRTLSDASSKAAKAELSLRQVHRGFNVFQQVPCIMSDLPKPELLHTMPIGMLDHLQKWIFHFMKTHKLLDKYNAIWLSVPAYDDLTPKMSHMRKFLNGMGRI